MAVDIIARGLAAKALSGGGGSGTGTNVVANPAVEATAELNKLTVGSTTYSVPKGTNVIANPTEAATSDLNTITIGSVVYRIPGGSSIGGLLLTKQNVSWEANATLDSIMTNVNQLTGDLGFVKFINIINQSISVKISGSPDETYLFALNSVDWQGELIFNGYIIQVKDSDINFYPATLFCGQKSFVISFLTFSSGAKTVDFTTSSMVTAGQLDFYSLINGSGSSGNYVTEEEFTPVKESVASIENLLSQTNSSLFMVGE